MKGRWLLYATVLLAGLVVLGVLGQVYLRCAVPYWSRTPDIRRKAALLRATPPQRVDAIEIVLGVNQRLTLTRPADDRHIDVILQSLKRMTVVDSRSSVDNGDDLILVMVKARPRSRVITIEGHLCPGDPRVSAFLRSDDLGAIVYDIFRRKGTEPRAR